MRIDKTEISGVQFMFCVACLLQSASLLISFLSAITSHESWLVFIICSFLALPVLYLYYTFMVLFPDKNLIQILEEVYGSVIGKSLGILYIVFFIFLVTANLVFFSDFINIAIMTDTPAIIVILVCVFVVAMGVRHGIYVVTRYGLLFVVVEYVIVALSLVVLINSYHAEYLMPVFTMPLINYAQSLNLLLTMPFGDLICLLMITPNISAKKRELAKYFFGGVLIGAIILVVVLIRDISVLGPTYHLFIMPALMTLWVAEIGESFTRMEIFMAVAVVMLMFFRISVFFYVAVIAVAQLFRIKVFYRLVFCMGAFFTVFGRLLYKNSLELSVVGQGVAPILWGFFELVVPVVTIVLVWLQRRRLFGSNTDSHLKTHLSANQ